MDYLPAKLETLMSKHFDLIGIPKRHFFAILALYSNHELEKERLTGKGVKILFDYRLHFDLIRCAFVLSKYDLQLKIIFLFFFLFNFDNV